MYRRIPDDQPLGNLDIMELCSQGRIARKRAMSR
jgi:hypothetical protein